MLYRGNVRAQTGPQGGGASLLPKGANVETGTTGIIANLASSLAGSITYSKVSGASSLTINSSTGAVSLGSSLADAATATAIFRAANGSGDAIEALFTATGVGAPVGIADFTLSNATVASTWGTVTVGTFTITNAPAGAFIRLRNEDAGFAIVEG